MIKMQNNIAAKAYGRLVGYPAEGTITAELRQALIKHANIIEESKK